MSRARIRKVESVNGHKVQLDSTCAFAIDDDRHGVFGYLAMSEGLSTPAFGGIRRAVYPTEKEALNEAVGLATQMKQKLSFADLPFGGAKVVLLDRPELDLAQIYTGLGQVIDDLAGRYHCGPDVGTGAKELAYVRSETTHVNHLQNAPGLATALGVLYGMLGAAQFLDWPNGLAGKRILLQGAGSVGSALASLLVDHGAFVLLHDQKVAVAEKVARAERKRGGSVSVVSMKHPSEVIADIFSPCAMGGVVDEDCSQFSLICGSANLQLCAPHVSSVLLKAGCLYLPEVAVNAGAVIEGVSVFENEESGRALANERIRATAGRVVRLMELSEKEQVSPTSCLGLLNQEES